MPSISFAKSALSAPHIYFAVSGNLLYIGETQFHPVIRWGAHLSENGSLRRALQANGDLDELLKSVAFFGVRCEAIETHFPRIQRKVATQAVEHEMHCLFAQRRTSFRLISDTVRTAPRRFPRRQLAQSIAEDILDLFVNNHSNRGDLNVIPA